MIGLIARMFRSSERVVHVAELENDKGFEVKASSGPEGDRTVVVDDIPPAPFVESMTYEGGEVVVSPLLDALSDWLHRKRMESRAGAAPKAPVPPRD